MNRLERLHAVAEEVRRRAPAPVTAATLAGRFGVTRRTVERDLAALRAAGLPLRAAPGRNGGHSLDAVPGRAVLGFTAAEVTALLLALQADGGMPFSDAARSAALRLTDALPPGTREEVDALRSRLRVVPDTQQSTPQVRRVLEEAVRRNVVVRIDYTDRHGRTTRRDVDPVGFYGANGLWSLVGWCSLRHSGRMFRLDRVRAAALTTRACTHADLDETLGWVPEQGIMPG